MKHRLAAFIALGLCIAVLAASYVIFASSIPRLEGQSALDTQFAPLVIDFDPVVYDMRSMIIDDESLSVVSDFKSSSSITIDEAEQIAREFLELSYDMINEEDMILSTWNEEPRFPIISLHMETDTFTFHILINSLSGKVIHSRISRGSISWSPYYANQSIIGSEIAEERVYQFLEVNDYTVPTNARYMRASQIGPPESDSGDWFIRFKHYAGNVPVESDPLSSPYTIDEGISFIIDGISGEIERFVYLWREIGSVNSWGVLDKSRVQELTLKHGPFNQSDMVACSLTFSELGLDSYNEPDSPVELRLVWIVVFKTPFRHDVLVDARTGEIIEDRLYRGEIEVDSLQQIQDDIALWVLSLALCLAVISFFVIRRLTKPLQAFVPS